MARQRQRSARGERRRTGRRSSRGLLGLVVCVAAACGRTEEPVLVVQADPPSGVERGSTAAEGRPGPSAVEAGAAETPPRASVPLARQEGGPAARVSYGDAERVFREGRYGEAADLFEAYANSTPRNPWGHYMLGIAARRSGDAGRAETALRRTVELDPKHEKGLRNLARVLLDRGKASDALDFARRIVELQPGSGEGWRVLGNVHAELNAPDSAAGAYRRAIALDPADAWAMNNLGLLRIQRGEPREALGPLARATELMPDVAVFQNNYGVALERSGYTTEAVEAFRAALDADPDHARARVSLERVEALSPSSPLLSVELSQLATEFTEEIRRWQAESRTAGGHEDAPGGVDPGC